MTVRPIPGEAPRPPPRSVRVECTDILFERRTHNLLSHILVALLILALGSGDDVWPVNLFLVGLLVAYACGSLLQTRWYNARPSTERRARRAGRSLYVQLAALGLLYNAIFLNLALFGVPHAMEYLFLIVAAYSAGGAASYQHLRGLAVVFIVFSIAPLTAYHLTIGHDPLIAFLLVVFAVFMSNTAMQLHEEAVQRVMLTRALSTARDEAEQQARTDVLTGLPNRRAFTQAAEGSLSNARRHGRPLAAVLLDIDHFKAINDEHGHAAGDAALRAVAETLRAEARAGDVVGRVGGEEFAIVLPDTHAAAATRFAERLRAAIGGGAIEHGDSTIELTVSLGVAERTDGDGELDALMRRADEALYEAKAAGRDRTVARV